MPTTCRLALPPDCTVTVCSAPRLVSAEVGTVRTFETVLTTIDTSAPDPEYSPAVSRLIVTGYVAEELVLLDELLEPLPDEFEPARLDDDDDDELLVDETGSRPMAVTVPCTGAFLPSGVTLALDPMCTSFSCRSVIVVET